MALYTTHHSGHLDALFPFLRPQTTGEKKGKKSSWKIPEVSPRSKRLDDGFGQYAQRKEKSEEEVLQGGMSGNRFMPLEGPRTTQMMKRLLLFITSREKKNNVGVVVSVGENGGWWGEYCTCTKNDNFGKR